jgi:NADH-quinone oxidoreductase subunit E
MSFSVPKDLEAEIGELISHYPQKRSAVLMVLHAVQARFGHISGEALEWVAGALGMRPIQVLELVTFYPMFRQQPAGRYQIKICRTLSCGLGGSGALHAQVCRRLGLNPAEHGIQTTTDGRFSVEFVECLAGCGTAPVMLCNDDFHEGVTPEKAEALISGLQSAP